MAVNNKINLRVNPEDYNQNHYKNSNPGGPLFTTGDFLPETEGDIFRSNMVVTNNRSLVMMTSSSFFPTHGALTRWYDNPQPLTNFAKGAEHFRIKTKDIDFDNVSIRKKVHKVYVTFKAGGYMSGIIVKYATNGSTTFNGTFSNTTYYSNTTGFDSYNSGSPSSDWITVALKPSSSINNVYSIQLEFSFANAGRINALQSATDANTITLDSNASGTANHYVGMPLYLYNSSLNPDIVKITSYNSSTKVADVSPNFADHTSINNSTFYDVGFIPKEFAINDISIVYREKPAK
tara:strand:- start:14328 stop:15203 length:876 start_codon:yes stop_codon:yes gene_type:complete